MHLLEKLNWLHPLSVAEHIPENEEAWVLLYSGMQTSYTGRYSFLALNKQEEVCGGFSDLAEKLGDTQETFSNSWFGYLGYGLKNELEKLVEDSPSFISSPDLWFARFGIILVFDHKEENVAVWGISLAMWEKVRIRVLNCDITGQASEEKILSPDLINNPESHEHIIHTEVISLSSNMTKAQYLQKVAQIKEAIKCGDLYQANLTRKFYGEIKGKVIPFEIFRKLCKISPAPYSAFIKSGDLNIISSSPERFLQLDKNGNANTRPIKGSAARGTCEQLDKIAILALHNSEKDRSENLMITDLSRNDLARNCDAGTIKVDELFNIETYKTIHHMVSSISGKKSSTASTLDVIKGCFPPGSMTGTPKIKAMEICSGEEKLKRGIYGGAIGWFSGDGACDFSVVIRTIILEGNKFEFQVGGAIIHDSEAHSELAETILKAKGICGALGIESKQMEMI